jgi:hypothetical protein
VLLREVRIDLLGRTLIGDCSKDDSCSLLYCWRRGSWNA